VNHSRAAPLWALLIGLDHGDDTILWGLPGGSATVAMKAAAASRSWRPGVQARVAGIRSLDPARMGLAWLSPVQRGRRSQALPAMTNCWHAALW